MPHNKTSVSTGIVYGAILTHAFTGLVKQGLIESEGTAVRVTMIASVPAKKVEGVRATYGQEEKPGVIELPENESKRSLSVA